MDIEKYLKPGFDAVCNALREMTKEQRYRFSDKLFYKHLSNQIRINRESRGLTQAQLAEKIGTHQVVISRWEKDCKGISIASLTRIAAAFDCALIVEFISWGEWVKIIVTPLGAIVSFAEDTFFFPGTVANGDSKSEGT